MPKKTTQINEEIEKMDINEEKNNEGSDQTEILNLNRMLAAVLNYLSDDEVEEIDLEYLLQTTEGLREWWDGYRESNKKEIEEEIIKSLGELSLKELEKIREQIKQNS